MYKKDYLQRQFEEFGKVLATILSLKKQNDWENFQKEINEAAKKFTSFEIDDIENLNEEGFIKEIISSSTLLFDQKKIIADLLFEKLDFYQAFDKKDRYQNLKTKCFILYEQLSNNQTENEFNLGIHYRLELLKKI